MDSRVSFVAFTLCISFLSSAKANDCTTTVPISDGFQECMTSYSTFMSNADFTTGKNPLCSPEGIAKTKCLMPFLANCPKLTDNEAFSSLKTYATEKSMQDMCKNAGAGSGDMMENPACLAASKCMEAMSSIGDSAGSSNANDSFGIKMFQPQSTMMCGPMKDMFACLDKVEGDCPDIPINIDASLAQAMPGLTLDKIKSFIKDYCSSLPSDFGTNQCVSERLDNVMSDECIMKATKNVETPTCSDFKNFFDCMPLSKCGAKYDLALRKTANFFVSMMGHKNCNLNQTSNSNNIRVSTLTVLFAVLMVLKLI